MKGAIIFIVAFSYGCLVVKAFKVPHGMATEEQADMFLEQVELKISKSCNDLQVKTWNYETNVTAEAQEIEAACALEDGALHASVQNEILHKFPNWKGFQDDYIRRQVELYSTIGPANLDPAKIKEQNKIKADLEAVHGSPKVCVYKSSEGPQKCNRTLFDADIDVLMDKSQDFDEQAYYWDAWHNAMAEAVPSAKYKRFMDINNEYANANNLSNMADMWISSYDDKTAEFSSSKFRAEVLNIWKQIKPYYDTLHAYVRMKLQQRPQYSQKLKKYEPYLPGNVLGGFWGMEWSGIAEITKPFPDAPSFDATKALKDAGFTPKLMFQKADAFYQSLGLAAMTDTFWKKSMIEWPKGRDNVQCTGSSHDFCLGKGSTDFRIKFCATVTAKDFYVIHHEMGHIQYQMAYRDQPYAFRDGANPGFHEAIGDTIALSVSTPRHLQCQLGLKISEHINCSKISPNKSSTPEELNFLYFVALEKLHVFPKALTLDLWRWGIYDGSIPLVDYNREYWELRRAYEGIVPPMARDSATGLDAAVNYHVLADVPYIAYFMSHVLQFQLYEAMCIKAGEFDPQDPNSRPLHQCDFGGSKEAGRSLNEMMQMGMSKPWPKALQVLTGSSKVRVEPLLNYFKPLISYMKWELNIVNKFKSSRQDR